MTMNGYLQFCWNKSCVDVKIYSNPTHDKHQWLLLQFIVLLKMKAKGVRNIKIILVVFNKHNTILPEFRKHLKIFARFTNEISFDKLNGV